MANKKLDELEKRKQELEQELHQIQDKLDHSIDEVRDDVSTKLDPKMMIRKHPLPLVGGAALIGFLMGYRGRGHSSNGRSSSAGEFSGALLAELKKLATRKAISFATDYVEDLLEEKADAHLSETHKNEEQ